MIRFAAIIALLLFDTGAALAGSPPKLDVQATCRRAQPLSGAEKSAYQGCLNDETEAQKELIKTWSSFKAGPQSTCVQETKIGGAPSYVELLTCLQLDKQAAEASRENKKQLQMPASQSAPSDGVAPAKPGRIVQPKPPK
ncbi:hypothetical protein SAMN05444161_0774 [Rhizobiales bacterium GAS191]|nr:hypothetical protein SAMN05519103_08264 [Rhizobiales bacterium GAS113]SEC24365.1 hypothetical protein SAMN05444161_0774 [Rhizobiales bacterium GAS191]SEC99129.1 hypothetical protein SAMN05519104_2529 [Rhizobiales bacterium GAS188]